LGRIPNPLENPLTTYNTAQGGNDEVLREFLQKVFLMPYYGAIPVFAKLPQKKNAAILKKRIQRSLNPIQF